MIKGRHIINQLNLILEYLPVRLFSFLSVVLFSTQILIAQDCTNLISNHEFEDGTNDWDLYIQASNTATFTIDNSSQLSGTNSALIDISAVTGTEWHVQFVKDGLSLENGKTYNLSFEAKSTTTRDIVVAFQLNTSPWTTYLWQSQTITSSPQTYNISFTANATVTNSIQLYFGLAGATDNVWLDNILLESVGHDITLSNTTVSSCKDHPLRDVATVDVDVSWSSAPVGKDIEVTVGNKTKAIDVSGGITSPQTLSFIVQADGTTDNDITAVWNNSNFCNTTTQFDAPAACSADSLACDILYLCGLDKPYDGDPWDHGWIEYLLDVSSSGVLDPILTKDEAGLGTYDVMNQNTFVNVNLDDYDLIIVSGTTEGHISADLVADLRDASAAVILGNYQLLDDFGMTATDGGVSYGNSAYINDTDQADIIDYDNPGSWGSPIFTNGNYNAAAVASLWSYAGNSNSGTNGIVFKNLASDALTGAAATHGDRTYIGYHFNGLYANGVNNGALPSPVSSWLMPEVHFTLEGKEIFDQALVDATTSCQSCPNPPTASAFETGVITCDNPTATVTANPSGMSYYWSNGATTRTQTVSEGGLYYVTVTDGNGCTDGAKIVVVEDTKPPTVTLDDDVSCGGDVELTPEICENYSDIIAERPLRRGGWNNTYGDTKAPLEGDGELCFTLDYLEGSSLQMIGLNNDHANTRSYTDMENAMYVYIRPDLNRYRIYVREYPGDATNNVNVLAYSSTSDFTGSSFCIKREGTTVTYWKDGSLIYTSPNPSVGDRYYDQSVHSSTSSIYVDGKAHFTDISLCGDLGMTYVWDSGETTKTLSTTVLGPHTVAVTDSKGCSSSATAIVTSETTDIAVTIDYNGSVCVTENGQLTALPTGGEPPYTYEWSGPNSFSETTETVNITDNGNYYLTVTDSKGCNATTSGYIYQAYDPVIVSLQTEVCEGETVDLTVNSGSAVSYQWSANAGGATSASVTVTPSAPSSTYTVTVTNDQGCTAVPEVIISANEIPAVDAGSDVTICNEEEITLSASNNGSGTSPYTYSWNNGLPNGATQTFTPPGSNLVDISRTYTVTITDNKGCSSTDDVVVDIKSLPAATITKTDESCNENNGTITFTYDDHSNRSQILLSIDGGSTFTTVNDNLGSYVFSSLSPGTYGISTRWTDNVSGHICENTYPDVEITSEDAPIAEITGSDAICVGGFSTMSPSTGGTWTSTNPGVATISNAGIVTGVSEGTTTFIFTTYSGCVSAPSADLQVLPNTTESISGDDILCIGSTTSLTTTATGGTWVSSNAGIATISSGGNVVAVSAGTVTISYELASASCNGNPEHDITISDKDTPIYTGPTSICEGATTTLTPSSGGTWTSNDPSIATITNGGVITGISEGTTTFYFTNTLTNCVSDASGPVTVADNVEVVIDFNGSQCITTDSKLTAVPSGGTGPYTYTWSGPNGFSQTGVGMDMVDIVDNGNYYVTVEDALGCDGATSGFVYQEFEAFVINLQTEVCEGETVALSASASAGVGYQWSANAGGATTANVVVTPTPPSSTYYVTITNNVGCTAVANAEITVNVSPNINITGDATICKGETTTLSPTSGGLWTSSDPSVATVSLTGLVTGLSAGTAYMSYIDFVNGCESLSPLEIVVEDAPDVSFNGPTVLCIGENSSLTPSSGGTWISTNPSVATVTNSGYINAVSSGIAQFVFTSNATGCSATTSQSILVNSTPTVALDVTNPICIGSNAYAYPSSGGQWSSSNTGIATITNDGVITSVAAGKVVFTYTSNISGCLSLPTDSLTISSDPTVSITGADNICINETTTLSPSVGGTWASENPAIATVTNFGVVTGIAPGNVRFIFTESATGCSSAYTDYLTVSAAPIATILGDNSICVGEISQLSPSTGGTWVSNSPLVASVTNSGLVTALASGTVSFTFTDGTTGCSGTTVDPITVYSQPDIVLDGPTNICIGTSTSLQPSTGGVWASSNNSIATISVSGVVTGVSQGSVTFTFTETTTGCNSEESLTIEIDPEPTVAITGDNAICVSETTTLSPTSGGAWFSDNPSVATVTNTGVVAGLNQGIARFTFISDEGCSSQKTNPIIVYGKPQIVIDGPTTTCIGGTLSISPSTGGTWVSSNPAVATITDGGIITGVSEGTVYFTFTNTTTGCTSSNSDVFTISAGPTISISGSDNICIGVSTTLAPTVGGIWVSNNPSIASVNNAGLVVGLSAGTATFTFTDLTTGCVSEESAPITVESGPIVSIVGSDNLCIGSESQLSPSTGGVWISTNPTVASVDNDGVVTALMQGSARFRFTSTSTGCSSELTDPITVTDPPNVTFTGSEYICLGGSSQLSPSTGGTWVSSDPAVATVNNAGLVTAVSVGTASFTFTDTNTGCSSDGLLTGTVTAPTVVSITGDNSICIGGYTTLSPSSGGSWVSSDPAIATVTNGGLVKGEGSGVVTFTFTDAITGCSVGSTTDPITIGQCVNNDFNVTNTETIISSSLSTNDNAPAGTVYNSVFTTRSKPSGSIPVLAIASDGSYTFSSTTPGKYLFDVTICIPPSTYGCTSSVLEITVIGNIFSQDNMVANNEMATTYTGLTAGVAGDPVTIYTLENDKCVNSGGCTVSGSNVSIHNSSANGSTTITASGNIIYTPDPGFVGFDTIGYQICNSMTGVCEQSTQIVNVASRTAENSTYAADDFAWGMRETVLTGNVQLNDGDPESDLITVTAQGSSTSPIAITGGTIFVSTTGAYTFTPNEDFTGYSEVVYTSCDDQGNCVDATLHILVSDDLSVGLRVYLEGALIDNGNENSGDNDPLMRDDLRSNPFDGKNYIPINDPYTFVAGVTDITGNYTHLGPGAMSKYQTITDSLGVFGVIGENAIVDWVFVELRSKENMLTPIATRSGLIQRDGDVVDLDGTSTLRFEGVDADSFYVVIKHRNHLGVMSMLVSSNEIVDFTNTTTPTFNFGQSYDASVDFTGLTFNTSIKPGYNVLWGGDFDSNGNIKYDNPNDDQNLLLFEVLTHPGNPLGNSNFDFAYGYYNGDYNMNGKAKFDNPDDDTNMLFAQLVLYQLNQAGVSNYSFFVEQIPR